MSAEDIETLFSVRSVVVCGSDAAEGRSFAERLALQGFEGPVVDWESEPSPDRKPIGVVLWPRHDVEMVLMRLKAHGCRSVVLIGPAASGGHDLQRARHRLRAFARRLGVRLIGPSRLGVLLPGAHLCLGNWSAMPKAGPLGLVTRSDSIAAALLGWAEEEGVGFSRIVSLGEADEADIADVIDALALDPATRAILLHLDHITHPRSALSALRAASRAKPVVVLRAGAACDPLPRSVTVAGRLASHDRVMNAAFARVGLVRAETFEALADEAEILGQDRAIPPSDPSAAPRVAIVSNGSGPAAIAADSVTTRGATLVLPKGQGRPLDLGAEATGDDFAAAVDHIANAREADIVVVLHWPAPGLDPVDFSKKLIGVAEKRSIYRPARIVVGLLGGARDTEARALLRAASVPNYPTPERAVRAALTEVSHARHQAAITRLPEPVADEARRHVSALRAWVDDQLLGQSHAVTLKGEAARPLVDVLGLDFGVVSSPSARAFLVGVTRDAIFGPVLVMAPAGRAEADVPTAIALPPLDLSLARLALGDLRLGRALIKANGKAANAIASCLVMLADIAAEVPGFAEIALDGVEFVGNRLEVASVELTLDPNLAKRAPCSDLAIQPYPRHLEQSIRLRDGRHALMRPIRPSDARVLQRLFARMTPEDRRMRLFVPLRELHDGLAARLTQIDYDREMCFVVEEPDGSGDLMAGARIVCDPDGEEAEYAVTVRSDLKGLGLGQLVLSRVLDYARERGVKRVWGSVLAENRGMLRLADRLGMKRCHDPNDRDVIRTEIAFA